MSLNAHKKKTGNQFTHVYLIKIQNTMDFSILKIPWETNRNARHLVGIYRIKSTELHKSFCRKRNRITHYTTCIFHQHNENGYKQNKQFVRYKFLEKILYLHHTIYQQKNKIFEM